MILICLGGHWIKKCYETVSPPAHGNPQFSFNLGRETVFILRRG